MTGGRGRVRQSGNSVKTEAPRRTLLLAAPILALAVLLALPASQAPASPDPAGFTPSFGLFVSNTVTGSNAAVTLSTALPAGNHLLGQAFYLVPKQWVISGDGPVPDGDVVGSVSLAADLNCDGSVDPPLTANLTDVPDADTHAHWNATLGPPLNLTLQVLVDINVDDPDVDYDMTVAVFPYNGSPVCNPSTFVVKINGLSGQGAPVITNPNPSGTYLWEAVYISSPVSQLEHVVSRFARACIGSVDADGDGVCNGDDICPNWPNQSQGQPPWPVPANDADCDGFGSGIETAAGTNPLVHCGINGWPADINNDTFSDISDVSALTGNFGLSVPPAPARQNIAPDPVDTFVDITDISKMTSFFGLTCAACPGDLDCDSVLDLLDNCPNWPNHAQSLPPWFIPLNDPDCDGFSGGVEASAGTDPLAHCGTDSWPADLNNDTFSDISDVSALTADFGTAVPPAPPRHNIAPNPVDAFVDITDVSKMTGFFGQTCQ